MSKEYLLKKNAFIFLNGIFEKIEEKSGKYAGGSRQSYSINQSNAHS